ncbi:TIR domain-containing protein [Microbacterium sp. bgisy189]|uniref:TIR domain-containing protein n=1 Tax=Microbacterium sp. bgisy189 TaxID=3413798 RepID=UPI003EBD9FC7
MEDDKPRARQNVVFELGFFIGLIGRSRVAVLYDEGVELPSDITGLVYIPLDSAGAWKGKLAAEMSHAQIDVDWTAIGRS